MFFRVLEHSTIQLFYRDEFRLHETLNSNRNFRTYTRLVIRIKRRNRSQIIFQFRARNER